MLYADQRSMMRTAFFVAALVLVALPTHAQLPKPLPVVVLDVRGFYGGLGQDPTTATELAGLLPDVGRTVAPTLLPKRAPGGVLGVHLYVLRKKKMSLGLGAEGVLTQARAAEKDQHGALTGFVVRQRLQGMSGQVSLNFGHRDGWSYLSAGMGPLAFYTYEGDIRPTERPPFQMTINMGGGARWFAWRHVAFGFDVRFYQTEPEITTASYPARQRSQLRVISAGISLR